MVSLPLLFRRKTNMRTQCDATMNHVRTQSEKSTARMHEVPRCNSYEPCCSVVGENPDSKCMVAHSSPHGPCVTVPTPPPDDPPHPTTYATVSYPGASNELRVLLAPPLVRFHDFKLRTIADAMELFRQLFTGMACMHNNHVCTSYERCMHEIIAQYAGTKRPRYCYAIPALSLSHASYDNPSLYGFRESERCVSSPLSQNDPFRDDIYSLGDFIRREFLHVFADLTFMEALIAAMVGEEFFVTPSIDDIVDEFEGIVSNLTTWTLLTRLTRRDEARWFGLRKSLSHVLSVTLPVLLKLRPVPASLQPDAVEQKDLEPGFDSVFTDALSDTTTVIADGAPGYHINYRSLEPDLEFIQYCI